MKTFRVFTVKLFDGFSLKYHILTAWRQTLKGSPPPFHSIWMEMITPILLLFEEIIFYLFKLVIILQFVFYTTVCQYLRIYHHFKVGYTLQIFQGWIFFTNISRLDIHYKYFKVGYPLQLFQGWISFTNISRLDIFFEYFKVGYSFQILQGWIFFTNISILDILYKYFNVGYSWHTFQCCIFFSNILRLDILGNTIWSSLSKKEWNCEFLLQIVHCSILKTFYFK